MSRLASVLFVACAGVALTACQPAPPPTGSAPPAPQFDRLEFNQLAMRANVPLFWVADANGDGRVDPAELATLLFYPPLAADQDALQLIERKRGEPAPDPAQPDGARRALILKELAQGRPTLVSTDLSGATAAEKTFVRHMLRASELIDQLFATQSGATALAGQLPADSESRSVFRRNWGPRCVGATTQSERECSAIPGSPVPVVDVYPASLDGLTQDAAGFCAALQKAGRPAALIDPFTVVRETGGNLSAVPYTQAYGPLMNQIADALGEAAKSLGPDEKALGDYLNAAVLAFRTNDWWPADEAWSRMNAGNSRWYVRVGPDEVYWEPCAFKAGFHLTLARVNEGSKQWQARLAPIRQDMEAMIAKAAGSPYRARTVTFDLPEFIDIVTNAGDDRAPVGGTIGQSLPNFGPVAEQSRGRTVAMVNLYTDADSKASARRAAESLFDRESLAHFVDESEPDHVATILHEAAHNLGPAQEYRVGGRPVKDLLGGPMNSLMEELKAQTSALYLVDELRRRGLIDDELAQRTYTHGITWAVSHISQGMWTEPGHQRKTYSQLSAIQIGLLMEAGALTWEADAMAANGTDKGAFHIHADKLVPAIDRMMKLVAGLKARGDRAGSEKLAATWVDGPRVPQSVIAERYARLTRVSLVYSLKL